MTDSKRLSATRTTATLAAVGALLAGAACAEGEGTEPTRTVDQPAVVTAAPAIAERVEAAVRDIETGHDLDAARGVLEGVLADPAATGDQRDDARLGLSRCYELQGDEEGAVRVVEQLLASHDVSDRYAARELAERRLRVLLTGEDRSAPGPMPDGKVAPVAKALAKHFVPGPDGKTRVEILLFGRAPEEESPLGTFNISDALRELRETACPLCDDPLSVSTSRSQSSSWVSLPSVLAAGPESGPTLPTALTVFYYDLESNRIPSRYDEHLPLPSDQVAKRVETGQGLIAVRTREGAPPVVLLAAPRWALLTEVEKAFAEMRELPTEPTAVDLAPGLRPKEIQAAIRGSYKKLRSCYDRHLESVPDAQGKIVMQFKIDGEGRVKDALPAESSTISDPTLDRCFVDAFSSIVFPSTDDEYTVRYAVALSPDAK